MGKKASNFSHTPTFASHLSSANCSLLVTTYQAGQLCSFGVHDGNLHVSMEPFSLAMGIALHPRRVVVGSQGVLWFLESGGHELANRLPPMGKYDAALLARTAHVTGNIQTHEMAYIGDELWVVNTLFSCLATIEPGFHFVPQWKPRFVSNCHVPGDRCHLNGIGVDERGIRYVTAIAETDSPAGWRDDKARSGCLIDVPSGEVVARGFAMPHSPRVFQGRVWLLDSGRGHLVTVDPQTGTWDVVTTFPGYTRGLSFAGPWAFVGLSRIRETAVFGGLPIAERRHELCCGVGIVDWRTGKQVAAFQFMDGVEEIFDVRVLPGVRCALIRGPQPTERDDEEIWVAPPPRRSLD